jgi:hypothetical protein
MGGPVKGRSGVTLRGLLGGVSDFGMDRLCGGSLGRVSAFLVDLDDRLGAAKPGSLETGLSRRDLL